MSLQRAGYMYQPGNYKAAADFTRELVSNPQKRRDMAAAGRLDVEAKGWLSAVQRIRDKQYKRAIRTFRAHKRSEKCRNILDVSSGWDVNEVLDLHCRFRWLAIRIWILCLWRGFWQRVKSVLDYAAPYRYRHMAHTCFMYLVVTAGHADANHAGHCCRKSTAKAQPSAVLKKV